MNNLLIPLVLLILVISQSFSTSLVRNRRQTTETGDKSELVKIEEKDEIGKALRFLLGDNARSLLLDEESPVQLLMRYNYKPLIASVATLVSFLTSENSPGYILTNYDYPGLLERLTPGALQSLISRNLSPTYGYIAVLASGLIIAVSTTAFLFYGFVFIYAAFENNSSRSSGGRSLDLNNINILDHLTEGVQKAMDSYKLSTNNYRQDVNTYTEEENFKTVIQWLTQLTSGSSRSYI